MHYLFIVLLVWAIAGAAKAQLKFDNTWITGYTPNKIEVLNGGSIINFKDSSFNVDFFETNSVMFTNASVSDTLGNLLFYTDGCFIANKEHKEMLNGSGLNPGFKYEQDCLAGLGYIAQQGALILPSPKELNN